MAMVLAVVLLKCCAHFQLLEWHGMSILYNLFRPGPGLFYNITRVIRKTLTVKPVLRPLISQSPFYRKHIVYVYKLCAELVPLLYFFVILYVALCSHCTSFHSGCFGLVLLPWELSYQSLAGLSFSYQTCLVKGTCLPDCVNMSPSCHFSQSSI